MNILASIIGVTEKVTETIKNGVVAMNTALDSLEDLANEVKENSKKALIQSDNETSKALGSPEAFTSEVSEKKKENEILILPKEPENSKVLTGKTLKEENIRSASATLKDSECGDPTASEPLKEIVTANTQAPQGSGDLVVVSSDTSDEKASKQISSLSISSPEAMKAWYTFENYHDEISWEVPEARFVYSEGTPLKSFNTHIEGYFKCSNPKCDRNIPCAGHPCDLLKSAKEARNSCKSKHVWYSAHIGIKIQNYGLFCPDYNASVYNQKCSECKCLGIMEINKDCYIYRVVRSLRKWSGVDMGDITYEPLDEIRPRKGTHRKSICEGCRAGNC